MNLLTVRSIDRLVANQMSTKPSDSPAIHYDRVSRAWRYLMGESFHYGYFEEVDRELDLATRALTQRMIEAGRVAAGHHVLDVGCGIGDPARYLALSLGCRVTGISTSETGVRLAIEESAGSGVEDLVAFEVRDGMDNGFPNDHFDRVWVMESSHLMPDKRAMLAEAARVLAPGGRLVLCDIITHRDLPLAEVVRRAHDFDLLRRVFGRAKMETLASYAEWLQSLGLEDVGVEDISAKTRPTFDRWQENADRYRDQVVGLIEERGWVEFRDSCEVLRRMWDDGVLGYGLAFAEKPR